MATKLFSGVDASKNPFTASTVVANPFAAASTTESVVSGPTGYALVTSGPAVDPSEVENAAQSSVEVSIAWGTSVLHVAHLSPPRAFVVGDAEGCDFSLPEAKLGQASAALVVVENGQAFAVLLAGAKGHMEIPGVGRLTLDEARERGQAWGGAGGAVRVALPAGSRVRQEVGDLVLLVGSGAAGKRSRRALFGAASATALLFAGLSMVGHLSVLGGLAFMHPTLDNGDDDESRREQQLMMQQFLKAAAEHEQEQKPEETTTPDTGAGQGSGAMAKDASGVMGSTTTRDTGKRFAIQTRSESAPREIGREQMRQEAANFGMIGLLQAQTGGERGPTAPWGAELSNGPDALTANGNLWGAEIGDSAGSNGLGLTGIGLGGGGQYEGLGTGKINTIFGGSGNCKDGPCNGVGNSSGRPLGVHQATSISVRTSTPSVSGRLAPEIIQRIVRQNFGRFRLCYENGLRSNPNLQGRVAVRFVIDRSGAVSSTSNGGSDLPDSSVVSCVVRSFSGLSFPQPENGIVSVTYPISFSPGT